MRIAQNILSKSPVYASDGYRYGFNGKEVDSEVKGEGNSYDFGARMYDPRLGRFLSIDRFSSKFPNQSPYIYASNTPIVAVDKNGDYTIFVNGYIYGTAPGPWDDIKSGKPYWRSSKDDPEEFVNAAHSYFGDGVGGYLNGSGFDMTSTASQRQEMGRVMGKKMAEELVKSINTLNNDDDPENDIKEINFVTHSMGAATAEGIVEEFMKYPEIASLMNKGEIVHFSACDGDEIKISENSKDIKRTQINYKGDGTLTYADSGADETGGYQIPGVKRFGVVNAKLSILHKWIYDNKKDWDFHHDTKTYKEAWNAVKVLDQKLEANPSSSGKAVSIESSEIK